MFEKIGRKKDNGAKISLAARRQQAWTAWKGSFRSKGFRIGGYGVLAALVVVAIAVAVNLAAGQLPSKVTKIDLSSSNLLSLSAQTKKIAGGLKEGVTVYYLVQTGSEDKTLEELLNRYKDLSDEITVKKIDPVVYPNFATQYTSDTVSENSLIVVAGERSRYIDYNDIYATSYNSDYTSTTTTFEGESLLTAAIQYVIAGASDKIYMLTGHGEATIPDSVTKAIANQNIDFEQISLVQEGSIPSDASCLMIYSPATDISSEEKDEITAYLENGGRLLLISDYVDEDMTNLYTLEESFGVKTVKGIVMEGDSSKCIQGYNYDLLPSINSHDITDPLISANYNILMPLAQGIAETGDAPNTVTITPLLTTSDQAYSKVAGSALTTYDKEKGDIDGPFYLGVAITDNLSTGSGDSAAKEARIVFYSSSAFLQDSVSELVSGANLDLFINSVGYLCEQDNTVSIHAKTVSADYLTVSTAASTFWAFVLIGGLPGAFLLVGIVRWILRRRR